MLALIDNYDSFTYNLVHAFAALGQDVRVFRHDRIGVDELLALRPERVVISPGPGSPADAGISCDVIRACAGRVPLLGVCLGMQCLADVYGGRVVPSPAPTHGKTSEILHENALPFTGLPQRFAATRYHSLIVDPATLPAALAVTAQTADGVIMGLLHRRHTLLGVQFHPESILTTHGSSVLQNFLTVTGGSWHA